MGLSRWLFKALAKLPNRVSFTISKKCKKKKKKKREKGEKRLSLAQHVLLPNTIEPADIYSWLSKAPKREIYNQREEEKYIYKCMSSLEKSHHDNETFHHFRMNGGGLLLS
jgi:hypothetical protein